MSEESTPAPEASPTDASDPDRAVLRLETRLAHAEAQIATLQEGMADINIFVRQSRQRALYLRIGLLVALLGAFFYLQSLK